MKSSIGRGNYKKPNFESLNIIECKNDISHLLLKKLETSKRISWDIETTGLDWTTDKIGTCQIFGEDNTVIIVKIGRKEPERLKYLLCSRQVEKVFHYAMFDLRFMARNWNIYPQNILCTKIASKLLRRGSNNGLQTLLKEYLNVRITKRESLRKSNWLANNLTHQQKQYAIGDVLYLSSLIDLLEEELKKNNLARLAKDCFNFIPTQLELDIKDYKDIYSY